MEFEGSEAGIVKFLRKMKVLGSVAGRNRESPQGEETARPGSNIVENVRFGRLGPLPGHPKMRAGNLLAQPTARFPS